jgi:single-strand DNA-binding protein
MPYYINMRGINKVILIGNATRDAELRSTGSGKAVASIRLATNRTIRGQEETQFHAIVCWETLAETVSKFVKKGDPLYVEGRLQYRSYQDEEGKERGVAEIVAADVQFLSRRKDESTVEPTDSPNAFPNPAPQTVLQTDQVSPDEIPF